MITTRTMSASLLDDVADGRRMTDAEALQLLENAPLTELGAAAHRARLRVTDPDVVTYVKDRNVNYTNVCITDCDFCAFYRRPGENEDKGAPPTL